MKKYFLKTGVAALGLTLIVGCNSGETTNQQKDQTEVNQKVAGLTYTCPMHPEVISQKPGKCPECGMNLEKATTGEHQHQPGDQH
ncbi:MAG: hypothetical protein JWQ14_506 [Adhaeribacter sp.]|jgi:uncharacterized protein YcfL|nr:hypothetical protein [Adhaeribacter sp.]